VTPEVVDEDVGVDEDISHVSGASGRRGPCAPSFDWVR
jgi:hypothetical protein